MSNVRDAQDSQDSQSNSAQGSSAQGSSAQGSSALKQVGSALKLERAIDVLTKYAIRVELSNGQYVLTTPYHPSVLMKDFERTVWLLGLDKMRLICGVK